MALVRLIARPMLSSMFIAGGINSLKNAQSLADRAQPVTDKLAPAVDKATDKLPFDMDSKRMVQVNGVTQVVGGAMLATGRSPRLASLALALTLVPTTFGGHRYWEETDPQRRANQRVHFLKNVSMAGGLLLASVDTEGKPSLAWQARHQAGKAKKRASKLTPN
ncbi:MAG: DoxX family protein [Nocardioidaceae bacterium]|nr:DoxX family protein [Nocardioidaceae bacterium]